MLHLVVGTIMYGYNMVEHSVTGVNNLLALTIVRCQFNCTCLGACL